MKTLTSLMSEYRLCLKMIWNTFLADEGDWDDRVYFCNASVQLFKAIVLYGFEEQDRAIEILPAYCSEQQVFMPIRVLINNFEAISFSKTGKFDDTLPINSEIELSTIDLRYVDLFDFSELSFREFKYVKVEIIESNIRKQIGYRLLIPFENAKFEFVTEPLGNRNTKKAWTQTRQEWEEDY